MFLATKIHQQVVKYKHMVRVIMVSQCVDTQRLKIILWLGRCI